jgi:hypothetical protein
MFALAPVLSTETLASSNEDVVPVGSGTVVPPVGGVVTVVPPLVLPPPEPPDASPPPMPPVTPLTVSVTVGEAGAVANAAGVLSDENAEVPFPFIAELSFEPPDATTNELVAPFLVSPGSFVSVLPPPPGGESVGIWNRNMAASSAMATAGMTASGKSSLAASDRSGKNSTPP